MAAVALLGAGALAALLGEPALTAAQDAAPASAPGEQPTAMGLLAAHGLHDLQDERWNAYGQFTYISSWKLPFPAPYTNLGGSNGSLLPGAERSFTGTATLYLGARLWTGAEAYLVPEVIAERPLSNLKGLGAAIQNFELQKGGEATPQIYRSRAYISQTFELGGERTARESAPLQLGGSTSRRRLVLTVGNFSILDFFDKNAFASDLRQEFFSLAFMTYGAYDFASDARGYSWGGVAELYWDDWVVRAARITAPQHPNQLAVDFDLTRQYGDQIELEHDHRLLGRAGAVRILAFRNREDMGRFSDAIAAFRADPARNAAACQGFNYGSQNAGAPDLCWVRRSNVKEGIGLSLEQHVTDDIGIFFRGMVADGQTEVDAYTATDRSLSFGALARGASWSRPSDVTGAGVNLGWISSAHAEYLRLGGVDGFIGDGTIHPAAETVFEVFYGVNVVPAVWVSADYQHILNPAFNADRGPVDIFGLRFHAQF